MNPEPVDAVLERVSAAQRVLIFSHLSPDGDALGSALGLQWLLRAQGKECDVSFEDPAPTGFGFLPGAKEVADRPLAGHDLVIAVDGSDAERYGESFMQAREQGAFIICIDHHKTNTLFAGLNWVDSKYAATAQMIVHLARTGGWEMSADAALCLATGCVTDTNGFSTNHTTPDLLETVASLMRDGASLATIMRQAMSARTQADVALWGRILSTMKVEEGIAWAVNRVADRAAVGAQEDDGGGIATFLRDIIGVHIGIHFTEIDSHTVRLSFRSERGYDVSELALSLGGGGHTQAAGATLHLPLEEAVPLVVSRARKIQGD